MVNTTITPIIPSKTKTKKERRAQRKREMEQLSRLTSVKPVYYNDVKPPAHLSKEQKAKEIRVRQWMDLQEINAISSPKHTSGLGNSPKTTWDKLQTAHKVSQDKFTCSSIADYEKKNKTYRFNHGKDMPVKRVSASPGRGKKPENITIEVVSIRMAGTEEKRIQHELK